jgi:hypothetical protein
MIKYSTEIDVAGLIIRDPVTALTNVLIFATALWWFRHLQKHSGSYAHSRFWARFALGIGSASLIGVIVHGFSYYTDEHQHLIVWLIMCIVQGIGVSMAQVAVFSTASERWKTGLFVFTVTQFLLFVIGMLVIQSYEIAKLHVAVGLVPILIAYALRGLRGERGKIWIAAGILVSALTAVVHTFKLSFSVWFNYNDIAHMLIVSSIILIGNGVRMTGDEHFANLNPKAC